MAGLGGHSHSARKRKVVADANAEKAKMEKEHDDVREALDILKEQLGTGTARASSLPETLKMTHQSLQLSAGARSDDHVHESAGIDMRSGGQSPTQKLNSRSFAHALVALTPDS